MQVSPEETFKLGRTLIKIPLWCLVQIIVYALLRNIISNSITLHTAAVKWVTFLIWPGTLFYIVFAAVGTVFLGKAVKRGVEKAKRWHMFGMVELLTLTACSSWLFILVIPYIFRMR